MARHATRDTLHACTGQGRGRANAARLPPPPPWVAPPTYQPWRGSCPAAHQQPSHCHHHHQQALTAVASPALTALQPHAQAAAHKRPAQAGRGGGGGGGPTRQRGRGGGGVRHAAAKEQFRIGAGQAGIGGVKARAAGGIHAFLCTGPTCCMRRAMTSDVDASASTCSALQEAGGGQGEALVPPPQGLIASVPRRPSVVQVVVVRAALLGATAGGLPPAHAHAQAPPPAARAPLGCW